MNPPDDPKAAFEVFRSQASADAAILEQLGSFQDIEAMAARAVEIGRTRGLIFTRRHVRDAWMVASRSWRERLRP